ncbi:hypothetical protein DUNSADRAFT_13518 [Dunaliella salina]|uniref:Uncharacterized protein n=1 Tax=Dunaliella salina TaxID=3046 RepID=A0ABQ7G9B4_DUNSA|nr:hypothetical protein DUNSADRAFT_13518 [Dunaliella salina]|eukprot:KAF5831161.1 hypothetical protein DUNSADRAFT_13518 [Dunaliella salina]
MGFCALVWEFLKDEVLPAQLLPKSRHNLWRLGELACQIKHAASAVTNSSASLGLLEKASSEQQQQQQQYLRQLQQQAASLMSASPEHGADGVKPELLDQMQVALEVWEKSESLQARLRSLFSLGTFLYCLGFGGLLIVLLPLARWLGVMILQVAYTTIPNVFQWLRLGQVIQDIESVLVFVLVRIHNVLLMPIYPGVGLLISTALIAAAKHQRQSAGSLLALSGIALAVLNLTVVLKLWLKWSKWLRMWALMQPLLPRLAPEDARCLVKGHSQGASGFATILALLIRREQRLAGSLRELERRSSPTYKEGNLEMALRVLFILVLSAPLARAHSSQLLGFGAATSLFLTAMMGVTAVENSLLGKEGRPPPGPLGNQEDSAWLIPGNGPEPMLVASLTLLLIQALAHGAGVSEQLAPFRTGFNVFGSMALLFITFLHSYKPLCKSWAEHRAHWLSE